MRLPSVLLGLTVALSGCGDHAQDVGGSRPAPATTRPTSIHWITYSDDVFARAKAEHKFVLLDLEAVWCHWCHVQDRVTYADPKVIGLVDSRYIAVKVDQDSRPDLASRYEDYGWPATIVFDASGQEIVKRSGYIPPRPMASMLQAIIDDPTPGPSVTGKSAAVESGGGPASSLDAQLAARLAALYDANAGGWGTIHKYVDWDAVEYCMKLGASGDATAEHQARQTLDAGLNLIDPVWGGVYQYSTDGDWVHPHYEKLLQFQAADLQLYSLAYARYGQERYLRAAAALRNYVGNFLTSPDGAFYVSQDADVVDGVQSSAYFALDDAGRRARGVPRVDTHCYARENGWMIQALLRWYCTTHNPADLAAATRAANWTIANRAIPGGGFRHDAADPAGPYLADSLEMARAFLGLYEATADRAWLTRAMQTASFIETTFADSAAGDGFITARSNPTTPLRPKPQFDENVAAARFFNLLYQYGGRAADRDASQSALKFLHAPAIVNSRRLGFAGLLLADDQSQRPPLHVTIMGHKDDASAALLFAAALRTPITYRRIEWYDAREGDLPNADVQYPQLDRAAAFVCSGTACSSPIFDPRALATRLAKKE